MDFFDMVERLRLEAADIAADTGEIQVEAYSLGYRTTFTHMGMSFEVKIKRKYWVNPDFAKDAHGKQVVTGMEGFEVEFSDEEGFAPSGKFGSQAFGAYGLILLAVKKLVDAAESREPERCEFLSFRGYDDKMDLVYDRFVRRHLASRYTRVDKFYYVRNDILQRVHDATGGGSIGRVRKGQRDAASYLASVKRDIRSQRLGEVDS